MIIGHLIYRCRRCGTEVKIEVPARGDQATIQDVLWEILTFNASRDLRMNDGRLYSKTHVHRCDGIDVMKGNVVYSALGVMDLVGAST